MSVLERCPSYKESNKRNKQRQGPTLGVRFTEVSVLWRCPLRESRLYARSQDWSSKRKPKTLHEEKKQNQACCRRCRGGADHLILTVLDYRPYHGDDSQGQSRSSVNFAGTCLWYVALIAQFKRLSSFA